MFTGDPTQLNYYVGQYLQYLSFKQQVATKDIDENGQPIMEQ